MSLTSWPRTCSANTAPRAQRRPAARARLSIDSLEERCLLSFSAPVTYPYGDIAAATADVNQDGSPDIVALNDSSVTVLLGQRNGQFKAAGSYSSSHSSLLPVALAVGDINGDGKPDIVVAASPGDAAFYGVKGVISILPGKGKGAFGAAVDFEVGGQTESVAVGDLNGDGRTDIVTGGPGEQVDVLLSNDATIAALKNQTGGDWPTQTYSAQSGALALADVNGDGQLDIIGGFENAVNVLLNHADGTGTFAAPQFYTVSNALSSWVTALAVGDIDGDGQPDVVAAGWQEDAAGNQTGLVSVLHNNGAGSLATAETYTTAGAWANSVALADFNDDGRPDIATTGTEMDVLLANGDGTFGAAQVVGPLGHSLIAADFNGDGYADLAEIDANGGVDVLLNKADGQTGGTGGKGHKK